MGILSPADLDLAKTIGDLSYSNPFGPERIELERRALGDHYVETGTVKAFEPGASPNPNMPLLAERVSAVLAAANATGQRPTNKDLAAGGDLALFVLYHRYLYPLYELVLACESGPIEVEWYETFAADTEALLTLGGRRMRPEDDAPGLLALFFQLVRAFVNIYDNLVGRTPAAAALRASMWESIFTHDLARYRRLLFGHGNCPMADIPTLITGPSGTGKELVASAIGRSAFLAFDPACRRFELDPGATFLPIHLASLSPSLIESELFGHRRGAFTGALEDRTSFLEACAPSGAVFLDEIAEIDPTLQVKLLRVLQTREFRRLGDSGTRRFTGRLISATNRDLAAEIEAGRFREDLYFRLNADRIETPSLRQLIEGSATELEHLVRFVSGRLLPTSAKPTPAHHPSAEVLEPADTGRGTTADPAEAQHFAADLCAWIEANLGLDYAWPGNFRELEQCARAFLIRGRYRPERRATGTGLDSLVAALRAGELTADDLQTAYCRHVHGLVGTFDGTARRLGLDRRTVKARVTPK